MESAVVLRDSQEQEVLDPECFSNNTTKRQPAPDQYPGDTDYESSSYPVGNATDGEVQVIEAPVVVNIVDDGDVIAVVGLEKLRFRVHSVILKMRSPTIAGTITNALQNSRAKGGRPTEIQLPKCDAEAFKALFTYFHKPSLKAFPRTVHHLLKVAALAKKWKCTEELVHASDFWLKEIQATLAWFDAKTCWDLAVAAFYFDSTDWFSAYTSRLMELHDASFFSFVPNAASGSKTLMKLAYALEENRHLRAPPRGKLRLEGIPPGTTDPAYEAYTQKEESTEETLRFSCLLLQEAYRQWSADELRLADYADGKRFGFGCGGMDTSNNPFQQRPPVGLCLKCFRAAKESFELRADCPDCQPRRTGETTVSNEEVNAYLEIARRVCVSQLGTLPNPAGEAPTEKHGTDEPRYMGTGAFHKSQQASHPTGGSSRPVANSASKQSTTVTGNLFGSGTREVTQKLPPAPKRLLSDTGRFSFGPTGDNSIKQSPTPSNTYGAAPQASSKSSSGHFIDFLPAQSKPTSLSHLVGGGGNTSTQSTNSGAEFLGQSLPANVASTQPKGGSDGLFGQSLPASVAFSKTTGGGGGLFGIFSDSKETPYKLTSGNDGAFSPFAQPAVASSQSTSCKSALSKTFASALITDSASPLPSYGGGRLFSSWPAGTSTPLPGTCSSDANTSPPWAIKSSGTPPQGDNYNSFGKRFRPSSGEFSSQATTEKKMNSIRPEPQEAKGRSAKRQKQK